MVKKTCREIEEKSWYIYFLSLENEAIDKERAHFCENTLLALHILRISNWKGHIVLIVVSGVQQEQEKVISPINRQRIKKSHR